MKTQQFSDGQYLKLTAIETALQYAERGWNPTPVIPGQKAARERDWPTLRIDASNTAEYFNDGDGVGLVLGPLSGGLVCVDLDSAAAVWLGSRALPETGLVATRPGKPDSHRFYVCDPIPSSKSFQSARTGGAIVEIKAEGNQIVAPPSQHPSGEAWTWSRDTDPARLSGDELVRHVALFAVVAELLEIWPRGERTGIRHEATMHLAGGLLRTGWTEENLVWLVGLLCDWSGDDERDDRLRAVRHTASKFEADAPTTGWPKLAELLDAHLSVARILTWLGVDDEDLTDPRPAIQVQTGNLDKTTARAWDAVAESNDPPSMFRRSNRPVRVERIDDTDQLIIRQLDEPLLKHELVERIRWYTLKLDKITKKSVKSPATPTIEIVRNMLAEPDIPLPFLNRVVPVPVFGPSGVLQTKPGYHADARVFYDPPHGFELPPVPTNPTPEQISNARSLLLDELLVDFPFVTDADRAHAVAFAILPFVRDMIDGPTPLHLFEAPKAGSGKGLAVRVLSAIFAGKTAATATPAPTVEEEWRKKIYALLLEGRPYVFIDNLNHKLDSGSFAAAITADSLSDRVLGVSETTPVPVRCVWVATANNPVLSNEIARRTVRSRINTKVEHPHLRSEFKHDDLLAWMVEHRARLVAAMLTLVQAWLAAGKPKWRGKRLGSFEAWSDVLGGILAVVGVPGFLDNLEDFYAEADDEGTAWRQFVADWWYRHGPNSKPAGELIDLASAAGIALTGNETAKQSASLGRELSKQLDNIYGDIAIRKGDSQRGKGKTYRLVAQDGREWEAPEPEALPWSNHATVSVDTSFAGAVGANPFSENGKVA